MDDVSSVALSEFLVIKGNFVLRGKEPDGDSLRFVADEPNRFASLRNAHRIVPSGDGSVQLRLEAIDAPELHYIADTIRQPLGEQARDTLLKAVGFSDVTFTGAAKVLVSDSEPDQVACAVLTKAADVHGRPIAYILVGDEAEALDDGDTLVVDEDLLSSTLNFQMVETGDAYCFVYTSTPLPHRQILRAVARQVRQERRGVYEQDTTSDFILRSQEEIGPNGQLIVPKLFRRCTDYLRDLEKGFDGTLPQWIESKPEENDKVVLFEDLVPFNDQVSVELSDLVRHVNDEIFVQTDFLNLTFVEK
jgi:endonuclease YncB( thermonuclease family)